VAVSDNEEHFPMTLSNNGEHVFVSLSAEPFSVAVSNTGDIFLNPTTFCGCIQQSKYRNNIQRLFFLACYKVKNSLNSYISPNKQNV